ncbi:MAG: methyltransferase domain-containing protein [Hyphomonadaceae bacterium]
MSAPPPAGTPPAPPQPFDARLLRVRKARAAPGFPTAAFLHARASADLAERLEEVPRPFARALVLGASAHFRQALAARPALAARVTILCEAELAPTLTAPPRGLAVELERLPFAEGAFDLIVSPLLLHWANDLPGALIQLRRALAPDGLMLASLLGGETLMELRLALIEAETAARGGASPRVSPFAALADAAALLQRAGFALPTADRDRLIVRYRDPARLIADLRAMGETNALSARTRRALTRAEAAHALAHYSAANAEQDGRARATFDVLTLTGWAPHDSQPKPLRPGSAKARLADALGVPERSAGEKPGEGGV